MPEGRGSTGPIAPLPRCKFGRPHIWADGLVDGVYTPDLYTCSTCGAVSDEREPAASPVTEADHG